MDLEGHLLDLINESPFCDMYIYYMHFWNRKKWYNYMPKNRAGEREIQ